MYVRRVDPSVLAFILEGFTSCSVLAFRLSLHHRDTHMTVVWLFIDTTLHFALMTHEETHVLSV